MGNSSQTNDWYKEILSQLDDFASKYDFPMLDNANFDNAAIRMTVFRSSIEWLIVFEEIALSKEPRFVNMITAYGNMIENPGTQQIIDVIIGKPGKPIWSDSREVLIDRYSFEVLVNGKVMSFSPSVEDYRQADVDISSKLNAPLQVLRLLVFLVPEEIFFSDGMLLAICNRKNVVLEKFMQLYAWHHPDLANDELPSQLSCFQSLARAIQENNGDLYVCSEDEFNTHWSFWEVNH